MLKTYHGTCHCGAVEFEVPLDLSQGTNRCNCTYCRKTRHWGAAVADPTTLRVTNGQAAISTYNGRDGGPDAPIAHAFCSHCGTKLFTTGDIAELGGRFASVYLPALEDATEAELIAAPVFWCDGLHDNWWNPAAETRHL
ncbi:GFA family protein [Neogemmobacter tilapiae]|jgi:hypothetical protein|uniref:Aldehyde-activating protein n=1 Tax=Neogemmobacter tilapiae TaxID=875041 RepID=A0A918TLT6_9RHOB|nr:GFA family protein [Gemmobacter tilapiae]GHC55031.1 aldehyde-activating protein [Gemmobacter tilapiae]